MRTKLFIAFFVVILIALVSNLIYENLIINDFEQYSMGVREDDVYRVLASVEGSYHEESGWDLKALDQAVVWATMLGFQVEVRNINGQSMITTEKAMGGLSPALQRRITSLVDLSQPEGEFEAYPLFVMGDDIGEIEVRPLQRNGLTEEKATVFKERGKNFLLMSFAIAGGGALFLSIVFSTFLTVPLKRLKLAAESVAGGNLNVKVTTRSRDEIGRLTKTFNQMVESLKREETVRQHLTQNIAHELRTPLSVMRSHLEAVQDGVIECNESTMNTIAAELRRLINLVEGIEDITKAEASFFKKPEYGDMELRGFLDGIVLGMRPLFTTKDLELNFAHDRKVHVCADPEKLEIAVRNIVSNALSHTKTGGATVDYGKAGDDFFVSVTDTGRGISEAELEKIFNRFYKGQASVGIGLGLSIARELVELMGGRITASSEEGKGSTFRITLPARED